MSGYRSAIEEVILEIFKAKMGSLSSKFMAFLNQKISPFKENIDNISTKKYLIISIYLIAPNWNSPHH